MLISFFTF